MRLEQLVQLVEIAECHSIVEASQKLHITQPNLSLSIKNLEQELGIQIFVRSRRGSFLTEEGIDIYQKSKKVLALIDSMYPKIASDSTLSGSIYITCTLGFKNTIEMLVKKIMFDHPLIKQYIHTDDAQNINSHLLDNNQYNIILTSISNHELMTNPAIFDKYSVYFIKKSNISLLSSVDSPYTKRKNIPFSILKNLPLISYSSDGTAFYLAKTVESYGIKLNQRIITNDYSNITNYIQMGLAYSLVTDFPLLDDNCTMIPLKEKIPILFVMLVEKSYLSSDLYSMFFTIISDIYPQLQQISEASAAKFK